MLEEVSKSASARSEVLVVCMGNELRGDDGVGVLVARRLKARGLGDLVVEAGPAPENYAGYIASRKPRVLVFVDAVEAGLEPGSVVLGDVREIEKEVSYYTTHKAPLSLILQFSGATRGLLLGIQVASVEMGSEMCREVEEAGEIVAEVLAEVLESLGG